MALGIEFDYVTVKDINWHFKPTGTVVKNFVEEPFDILIDLSMEPNLSIDWVLATSVARLKVGRMQDNRKHLYDLMIAMKPGDSLPNLMTQVNHYLTEINKQAS